MFNLTCSVDLPARYEDVQISGRDYRLPLFDTEGDAHAFAMHIALQLLDLMPGPDIVTFGMPSDKHGGNVADLALRFRGWEMLVVILYSARDNVVVLAVEKGGKYVLVPVGPFSHIIAVKSGDRWVRFLDRTAFCWSLQRRELISARALFFAPSWEEAREIWEHGGWLELNDEPAEGCAPVCFTHRLLKSSNVVRLPPKSFRIGTPATIIQSFPQHRRKLIPPG
jgi:hypothetical protein